MGVVVFVSILAVLLAYFAGKGSMKRGLDLSFLVLTAIGAIHYNYGSDYNVYVQLFSVFSEDTSAFKDIVFRDPGWVLLNRICKPIGFFGLLILVNVVMNLIYYWFIKKHVPAKMWWLAVAIYVFSTSFYLMNFSMLRQGLAISLFLLAVPLIIDKKIFPSLLVVLVASTIHSSAIILLPFVFWGLLPQKFGKLLVAVYVILFALFLFGGSIVEQWLNLFLSSSEKFEEFANYNKTGISFGLGFMADMVTFIVYLSSINSVNFSREDKLLISLTSIGSVLIPFQQIYLIAGRVSWYFGVLSILAIPMCYDNLKSSKGKPIANIYLSLFFTLLVIRYYLFFHTGAFVSSFNKPFEMIFSVPWM